MRTPTCDIARSDVTTYNSHEDASMQASHRSRDTESRPQRKSSRHAPRSSIAKSLCTLLISSIPAVAAQGCISLERSRACSAFNASSISTDSFVTGLFPFLSNVRDVQSFDSSLEYYVNNGYAQSKYQNLIGCSNLQLGNTTDFYARYTTSVLCNAIIQNSITPCGLSGSATQPLCANSCADFAQSEQRIVASDICGSASNNYLTQIRADFTNCALPADSLSESCIEAVVNQPDNCGFSDNLSGLCSYCSSSSPNGTDSCCVFSDATSRCRGVTLPVVASASLVSSFTVTTTASTTTTVIPNGYTQNSSNPGLTRGQIAGVVIGSVLGAFFLLGLVILGCLLYRRHRDNSPNNSIFNQPSAGRVPSQMSYNEIGTTSEGGGLTVLGGGRVARMSALEGGSNPDHDHPAGYGLGGYAKDISDDEDDTPDSRNVYSRHLPKRGGSLSSGQLQSFMAGGMAAHEISPVTHSDNSNTFSTPESRVQSEQLSYFKDYYSNDLIHPSDQVAALWAYEPHAADEFQLERGDMIRVLGIWDDGWATGTRVKGVRADDWREQQKVMRDSGHSQGQQQAPPPIEEHPETPEPNRDSPGSDESEGDVKAFPLVCVCLPQHWRKTLDGESAETGPGGFAGFSSVSPMDY